MRSQNSILTTTILLPTIVFLCVFSSAASDTAMVSIPESVAVVDVQAVATRCQPYLTWPAESDLASCREDSVTSLSDHIYDACYYMAVILRDEYFPKDPLDFMTVIRRPKDRPTSSLMELWTVDPSPFFRYSDRICFRYGKPPYTFEVTVWDWDIVITIRDDGSSATDDKDLCLSYLKDLTHRLFPDGDRLWVDGYSDFPVEKGSAICTSHNKEGYVWWWTRRIFWTNRHFSILRAQKSMGGPQTCRSRMDWFDHSASAMLDEEKKLQKALAEEQAKAAQPTPRKKTPQELNTEQVDTALASLATQAPEELVKAAKTAKYLKRRDDAKRLYEEAIARTTDKAKVTKIYMYLAELNGIMRDGGEYRANMRRCLDLGVDDAYSAWAARMLAASYANTTIGDTQLDQQMAAKLYEEAIARFGTRYYQTLCCYMGRALQDGGERGKQLLRAVIAVDPDKVVIPPLPDDRLNDPREPALFQSEQRADVVRIKQKAAEWLERLSAPTPAPVSPFNIIPASAPPKP